MRYVRLYLYFIRFSVSRSLEFRFDFCFRIMMDTMYYVIQIIFFKVLFLHTAVLGGWSEAQAMIFVAGFILLDAVQMTLFSNNMWWLPIFINNGALDYYLIRPVPSLFILSLRDFAVNSFVNLLMASTIFGWIIVHYGADLTGLNVVGYLLLLLNGAVLHYLTRLVCLIPTFWTHSGSGFVQIFWTFERLMSIPHTVFTGWARLILTTILPFGLMASVPAQVMAVLFDWRLLGQITLVTVAFWLVALRLWQAGLRAYSSASS